MKSEDKKSCLLWNFSTWKHCFTISYNQEIDLLVTYKNSPLIQVKEWDGLVKIWTLRSCLHVQFTNSPTILDVSLLSSFIHFADTTNLNDCIELQRYLCFIYSLDKYLNFNQTESIKRYHHSELQKINLNKLRRENSKMHSLEYHWLPRKENSNSGLRRINLNKLRSKNHHSIQNYKREILTRFGLIDWTKIVKVKSRMK